MIPYQLLRDVRRRTLELVIDNGDLDYKAAERQAAREIANCLNRKITARKATRVQGDQGADCKAQLLRKLKHINRRLASSCGQPVAGCTGGGDVGQLRSYSPAERLSLLPVSRRAKIIQLMPNEQVEHLMYDWDFWGRPKQLPPPGDWSTLVLRAGRAFGKDSGRGRLGARPCNGVSGSSDCACSPDPCGRPRLHDRRAWWLPPQHASKGAASVRTIET